MFIRTISTEDLARLKVARDEADAAYQDALGLIDRSRIQDAIATPHPPPPYDEHQITPLNELWPILGRPGAADDERAAGPGGIGTNGGWRGRLAAFVWRIVAPAFERQQQFNAQLVDHLNRNVTHHRELQASIASTIQCLADQLDALRKFELLLVWYLQKLTVFVDTRDAEAAGLGRRITEDAREIVDILDHRTVGLAGAVGGVSDELLKRWESMVARERRFEAHVSALTAAHADVRSTMAVVQQTSLTLKRELERLRTQAAAPGLTAAPAPTTSAAPGAIAASASPAAGGAALPASGVPASGATSTTNGEPHVTPPGAALPASGVPPGVAAHTAPVPTTPGGAGSAIASSIDSYKYVGFEDRFRGSQEDIRARLTEYLPYFQGASDVLDVGCGRGEFLDLLREHGIGARGLDVNHEMVEVCRARGLHADEGDALAYLAAQPDGSLGGLLAAQVVEHLDPGYLMQLLDVAYHKLRPGAHVILETINVACWYAFFSSYIRDLTHVRPIHPETLGYLLTASGFQRVTVRYSAPFPQRDKLQHSPLSGEAATDVFNENVDKLNALLFTSLDYAAIGVRL